MRFPTHIGNVPRSIDHVRAESYAPPVAPDFAGIGRMQLVPADLLDTISLGDPIDALPCQGGLVTGDFVAAGTARPVLADDGVGRGGGFPGEYAHDYGAIAGFDGRVYALRTQAIFVWMV